MRAHGAGCTAIAAHQVMIIIEGIEALPDLLDRPHEALGSFHGQKTRICNPPPQLICLKQDVYMYISLTHKTVRDYTHTESQVAMHSY